MLSSVCVSRAGLDGKWPETQFYLTRKRMEPAGMEPPGYERHGWADPRRSAFRVEGESTRATSTGTPEGVFAERKHHKPRLALNNNTAGVREREDENHTRVAGHRDDVEGVVANPQAIIRSAAVGFIDWLEGSRNHHARLLRAIICLQART
jgi:hypothetical protein